MAILPIDSERAQACILGQLAGDSLGSLVEFKSPEEISSLYPDGVRRLAPGGIYNTLPGQPTDDSEMALMLARSLVKEGRYDSRKVLESYKYWLNTGPFDLGNTIASSLNGTLDPYSQANGALMRISPLGIFGAGKKLEDVADWAREDAALTHINPICLEVNALYAMAIAWSVETGPTAGELFQQIKKWAREIQVPEEIQDVIAKAETEPPPDFMTHQGWVLIAFQNALYQLNNSHSLSAGLVDTVGRGGDTDTNAAICGALMGAVYGLAYIPGQWERSILTCRPDIKNPDVHQPRPEVFWPVDAMSLALDLLLGKTKKEGGYNPRGIQRTIRKVYSINDIYPELLKGADAPNGSLGVLKLRFAENFEVWGIFLPEEDVAKRAKGEINEEGWTIQYVFGSNEKGEYLDYFSGHRMTNSVLTRLYADGSGECLGLDQDIRFISDDPDEQARLDKKYQTGRDDFLGLLRDREIGSYKKDSD